MLPPGVRMSGCSCLLPERKEKSQFHITDQWRRLILVNTLETQRVKWQTASKLLSVRGVTCRGWKRDWTFSSKNLCFQSYKSIQSHHSLEWDTEQCDCLWARPRVLSLRCVMHEGEPPPSEFSTSVSHTQVEPDGGLKLLESLQDNFGWERLSESTHLWTDLSTWGSTETRSSIISHQKNRGKE